MLIAVAVAVAALAVAAALAPATAPAQEGGCPNADVRAHQGSEQLPDCRGYELVTPAGGDADVNVDRAPFRPSTPDGRTVCFSSSFSMDGAPPIGGVQLADGYCGHRTADGWDVEWVTSPRGNHPFLTSMPGPVLQFVSDDGRRQVFSTQVPLFYTAPVASSWVVADSYLRADGRTEWLSAPRQIETDPVDTEDRFPLAASADARHAVMIRGSFWESRDGGWSRSGTIKEWADGTVRDVAVDDEGNPVAGSIAFESPDTLGLYFQLPAPGTISRDGSRIFFEATGDVVGSDEAPGFASVYVREDGITTRALSPRRGDVSEHGHVTFGGATPSGEHAFLLSREQLTETPVAADAGLGERAVYRVEVDSGATELVADRVRRVLGFSNDGSTLFFSGTDVLEAGEGLSLYVSRGGTVERVSALAFGDETGGGLGAPARVAAVNPLGRALRISADGGTAAFVAEAETPGEPGLYRWTPSGGRELIARDPAGNKVTAELAGSDTPATFDFVNHYSYMPMGRGMTSDGQRIFITTHAQMVESDDNDKSDVYMWSEDAGLQLISPGAPDGADAVYMDNSDDGDTIFFVSYERILPGEDVNSARDMYAARVGGGYIRPVAPECSGDGCQGGSTPRPAPDVPGSLTDPGADGPLPAPARAAVRVRGIGRKALAQAGRSGRLAVPVSVRGSGRLVVRATAKVGGRMRLVARTARRIDADRQRRAEVTLQLSRPARRAIARGGSLRLRIVVALGGRRASDTVTVRRPR